MALGATGVHTVAVEGARRGADSPRLWEVHLWNQRVRSSVRFTKAESRLATNVPVGPNTLPYEHMQQAAGHGCSFGQEMLP